MHTEPAGAVNAISIANRGYKYTCSPGVFVVYTESTRCGPAGAPLRSDCAQDGTITAATVRSQGTNYISGDIRVQPAGATGGGSGFAATFTAGAGGVVAATSISISNHGAGYVQEAVLVSALLIVCVLK
jgi:hypothetical protein